MDSLPSQIVPLSKPKMKPKPVIRKSCRLFDFRVYDDICDDENDDGTTSSGSEDNKKYKKKELSFHIQMFGINERGETFCLYIKDYEPFFFIKIGDKWSDYDAIELLQEIKNRINNKSISESIRTISIVEKNKLYGFSAGKPSKFAKIVFKNTIAMNKVKNLWYTYDSETNERCRIPFVFKKTSLELYESNIPSLLRYFHINEISPSGWVSFKMNRVILPAIKKTSCRYEYIISLKELNPMPEKETRVPYKICSFDIEASSSHGDFPLPVKTYKRLATQVVDVFQSQLKFIDEKKSKILMKQIMLAAFGFDRFEDVDLVYPKKPPSMKKVEEYIQILINENMEDAIITHGNENNDHLLKIDSIFSRINEESYEKETEENQEETEEIQEDFVDETEENTSENMVKLKSKTNTITKTSMKPKTKTNSTNPLLVSEKKTTILDILMNQTIIREEKIQTTNDIMTRLFPQLEGDKTTFIGSTFMRYGEKEPYFNHCLVLGSCNEIPGAVIETTETEKDLLIRWTELIQKEDPDIIIGYNIFGFDYEFLFRRSIENNCHQEFMMLSRIKDESSMKINTHDIEDLNIENTKIQIASGEYDLRYFKMTGRLQIDMYTYFRRDFNLSSYKLDDVAGQFIGDSISKIIISEHEKTGHPITELYSQNLMGLHAGDYIHIEISGFTTDYYKDGTKFLVEDIIYDKKIVEMKKDKTTGEMVETTTSYNVIIINGHESIDCSKHSIRWGTAKDDVSPQDIFRLSNGSSTDRAIVAKYCIQDCNLVHHLMNKIDVITGYIEMSRICSVPISFLVFRGQGIKLTSFVAKKCRDKNTLMPDLEKSPDADGYEGAIVLPPKCSMYMDNPVACVDYSSLYPSSMISQNYSHDSKVWSKEYNLKGELIRTIGDRNSQGQFIYDNLPGYEYINIEYDTFKYIREKKTSRAIKTLVGKKVCRWAQLPNNQKSIMPSILEELLKARSDTRKMIKTEKDPFMQNILDKRQLGYKVTANSLYGQCGSRTSTFYEKDVAASTTATGRMMIIYAKRIIEEVYGDMIYDVPNYGKVQTRAEYVYGDTDSVFFTFNLENPETGEKIVGKDALAITIEIAQDAAKLCSQWLKAPMELSYEKTLMPFILLSKKRYVGMLYETDPNKGKLKYMGLSLKRRDSCDYLKDIYGGILNILMKENNIKKSIEFLNNSLKELIEGNVPIEKLTITKALRSHYKNPHQIGHKVLADRIGQRDPGNKPKSGERIKFVFIAVDNSKALMGDKIETPEFIHQNKLQIDYTHYITNQLMKPLQQLFGLALEQIWELQNKKSAIKEFKKEIKLLESDHGNNLETFMKKREKLCSTKIKVLLFDKFLDQIYKNKNRIQSITSFYKKV
jgi:DNA polymerase elongation subunit (family B)